MWSSGNGIKRRHGDLLNHFFFMEFKNSWINLIHSVCDVVLDFVLSQADWWFWTFCCCCHFRFDSFLVPDSNFDIFLDRLPYVVLDSGCGLSSWLGLDRFLIFDPVLPFFSTWSWLGFLDRFLKKILMWSLTFLNDSWLCSWQPILKHS